MRVTAGKIEAWWTRAGRDSDRGYPQGGKVQVLRVYQEMYSGFGTTLFGEHIQEGSRAPEALAAGKRFERETQAPEIAGAQRTLRGDNPDGYGWGRSRQEFR